MTLQLTDRLDIFTQATFDILDSNKAAVELQDVWYGDQDRIPRTPAAAVEAGPKRREFNGAPRRFLVTMSAYILVYSESIQDTQENERLANRLAEDVEELLHADATMGGLVIDSYVSNSEPGMARRSGTLLRVTRLTFEARSQKQLPYGT